MPGVKAFSARTTKMEKSRVCRCLFGRPDRALIRKDLDESLQKTQQEATSRWNFNFEDDVPLKGRYEWDVIETANQYIPSFYTKGYVSRHPRLGLSGDLSKKDSSCDDVVDLGCVPLVDSENSSQSSEECNKNLTNNSETKNRETTSRSLVQTQIDDFCKKRKRARGADEENSSSKVARRDQ